MTDASKAELEWTPWTLLDGLGPLLMVGTDQTLAEVSATLEHLGQMGLMRFGRDEAGALYYQVRMDDAARALALLDDLGRPHPN